jgi:hypothetical protein
MLVLGLLNPFTNISTNPLSLQDMGGQKTPLEANSIKPAIAITLDDGFSCGLIPKYAFLLLQEVGYIKNEYSRPEHYSSSAPTIHIPGVRRDLWLSLQNTIAMNRGVLVPEAHPTEYKGRADMTGVGKNDIRICAWDCGIHYLLELMIVGENLQAPGFQNQVMDKLLLTYRKFYQENEGRVPLGNVEYVFENSRNERLRDFVRDVLIFAMSDRMTTQAFVERHISEELRDDLKKRWDNTQRRVRDAPWDHPGDYQVPRVDPISTQC